MASTLSSSTHPSKRANSSRRTTAPINSPSSFSIERGITTSDFEATVTLRDNSDQLHVSLSPLPSRFEIEEPSEEIPKKFVVTAGEYTEQLSDVSDKDSFSISKGIYGSSRIATWLKMQKAIGEKKFPCLYTYLPWSECSATCWNGKGNYPQRYRKVNKTSIVQARGGIKPNCPSNLASRLDFAPCNTYRCPTNLSSYGFIKQCFEKDARRGAEGGCYRIRDVPLDDRLIFIDANLTQDCEQYECTERPNVLDISKNFPLP